MSIHLAPDRVKVSTIVTALFADRACAERGWEAVTALGYKRADISAVVSHETHKKLFATDPPPLAVTIIRAALQPQVSP